MEDEEFTDVGDIPAKEVKARYHKVANAVEAISHIVNMLQPHPADAYYVIGASLGATLFKCAEFKDLDDTTVKILQHARKVYDDLAKEEAEAEAKNENVKH